jgi:hypothetical protein
MRRAWFISAPAQPAWLAVLQRNTYVLRRWQQAKCRNHHRPSYGYKTKNVMDTLDLHTAEVHVQTGAEHFSWRLARSVLPNSRRFLRRQHGDEGPAPNIELHVKPGPLSSTCAECFFSLAVIASCRITGNMRTIVAPKPKRNSSIFDLKIE